MALDHAVVIAETGDISNRADGMQVILARTHLLVRVCVFEREAEIWVPIQMLLDSIAEMTRHTES